MADDRHEAARDRLGELLAAYGADPARWPEADRELAELPATADGSLDALLTEARNMDLVLATASYPVAPPGAAERLIAIIGDRPEHVVALA